MSSLMQVDAAACLFRVCRLPDSISLALGWKRSHLSVRLITASIKNSGHPPKSWQWEIYPAGRVSWSDNLNFLKQCPKLPVPAHRTMPAESNPPHLAFSLVPHCQQ